MCGIAGTWGSADSALVQQMMDMLSHRGPDAQGMHVVPNGLGVFGHRRLSIMDVQGGDQPIYNEDGSKAIVANGEIYNFPLLRESLDSSHRLRTRSDTEIVLHLYEDLGKQVVHQLDGMFAFAISDGAQFFAARDPIGIKPLYFGKNEKALYFASELKVLAGVADEVWKFPPGSWFHSNHGFHQFYEVPRSQPVHKPLESWVRAIRSTLEDAVGKRLMSDVPVGAFLSGGLDSSLIAAIARRHLDELHTFSVGVAGSRDLEAARVVARHLDTIHHEHIITPQEVTRCLPEIIYHLESFDQDLVRSAIPTYFVSRLASADVKVILTGEGADELFAGYTYYKSITNPETLHDELRRSVETLHNINLQRVDRMTMAHSIEGRVPFLDVAMIDIAQSIPPKLKLACDDSGKAVEKWILRKACEDLLPEEIVWRKKEQFDEGSGTVEMLGELVREIAGQAPIDTHAANGDAPDIRTPEEYFFYQNFKSVFPEPAIIEQNMGRWAVRPEFA